MMHVYLCASGYEAQARITLTECNALVHRLLAARLALLTLLLLFGCSYHQTTLRQNVVIGVQLGI